MLPLFVTLGSGTRYAIQILTMLIVLVFLVYNASRPNNRVRLGFAILLIGWALNFTVIALNGAMPVSSSAFARSGQTDPLTPGEAGFFKIEVADERTRLRILGDVIPLPAIKQVVSVGDLVLMLGIATVLGTGMQPDNRREGREQT